MGMANACVGLEALLCGQGTEIRRTLALRAAKLMSCYGFKPLQVREDIRAAYEVRSAVFHGGPARKPKDIPDRQFVCRVSNFLRIILHGHATGHFSDLEKLRECLDRSMIDEASHKELAMWVRSHKPFAHVVLDQVALPA